MPALLLLIAAIALLPKPYHYVTDRAGVLPFDRANALNEKLANFERQTSDQILVYIDRDLPPDTTVEELGSEAMRKWGVGQKGKDNGAILFVFTNARKMRIEVGYGLEGSLTDAKSKWITSMVIKPEFQRGDYGAGIERGVDAMLATIRGEAYRGSGKTVAEKGRHQWAGVASVVVFGLIWVALVLFGLRWVLRRARGERTWSVDHWSDSSSSSTSSSSSFSSSSSSGSSSSFSGGGGSDGGGGASDSW